MVITASKAEILLCWDPSPSVNGSELRLEKQVGRLYISVSLGSYEVMQRAESKRVRRST